MTDQLTHSDRVRARAAANTPWTKPDRAWIQHPFYVQVDVEGITLDELYQQWLGSDTRDTMPEGQGE